jgi:hypothetical protein
VEEPSRMADAMDGSSRPPRDGPTEHNAAHKNLLQLDLAESINDLRIPTGNLVDEQLRYRIAVRSGPTSCACNPQAQSVAAAG